MCRNDQYSISIIITPIVIELTTISVRKTKLVLTSTRHPTQRNPTNGLTVDATHVHSIPTQYQINCNSKKLCTKTKMSSIRLYNVRSTVYIQRRLLSNQLQCILYRPPTTSDIQKTGYTARACSQCNHVQYIDCSSKKLDH